MPAVDEGVDLLAEFCVAIGGQGAMHHEGGCCGDQQVLHIVSSVYVSEIV